MADNMLTQKIIDLNDYRFMAFVGWDCQTIEARIGILAQNFKNEDDVKLIWIIVSHPYVKTNAKDLQFIVIEREDMIF